MNTIHLLKDPYGEELQDYPAKPEVDVPVELKYVNFRSDGTMVLTYWLVTTAPYQSLPDLLA